MKVAVGIFVTLFFISITVFGYAFLKTKGVFEKHYSYYFLTDSASSFSVGMPLKFSGFAIGQIDKMLLLDSGEVKVYFSVTQENRKWINRYTYLLLKKPLLGSPHIEVLATSGNGFLKPGSELPIIVTDDINDLVTKLEPVVDRLLNIIKNVETMTNTLVDTNSSFNNTLKNIERFSAKLAHNDALLTSVTGSKQATKETIEAIHHLNGILSNIDTLSKKLDGAILQPASDSIKTFHTILLDLHRSLKDLAPLIRSLGHSDQTVNTLKENIETAIEKSNRLLDKIDALLLDEKNKEVQLP